MFELTNTELVQRFQRGDEHVCAILITRNRGLIFRVIRKLRPPGWYEDDLVADGMVAIWRCAKSFDPAQNTAFSTFATRAIWRDCLYAVKKLSKERAKTRLQEITDQHQFTPLAEICLFTDHWIGDLPACRCGGRFRRNGKYIKCRKCNRAFPRPRKSDSNPPCPQCGKRTRRSGKTPAGLIRFHCAACPKYVFVKPNG